MIKLIGFDLDDTLLTSKGIIDDLEELNKLPKMGIRLALISGRPLVKKTIDFYHQLKESSDALYAAYNGAIIYTLDGNIKYTNMLSHEEIKYIYEVLHEAVERLCPNKGIIYSMHCANSDVLLTGVNKYAEIERNNNKVKLIECEFYNDVNIVGPKVMLDGDPELIKLVYDDVKDKLEERFHTLISMPCYIEVLKKDVNKGNAIKMIASLYGINEDEIMAFGDAGNDLEMVRDASIGVCMQNGTEEVKNVADYITDSNDNHGILKALKHFHIL